MSGGLELARDVGASLAAGLPVAIVVLREVGPMLRQFTRAVGALERIADRMDGAEYVKFDIPPRVVAPREAG